MSIEKEGLNRTIDHTNLKSGATRADIELLCRQAREHEFASVCVNPVHVALCAELLRGSRSAVCTVVGFPLGATVSAIKAAEAAQAVRDGAGEVDMVIDIGAARAGDYETVQKDIACVRAAVPAPLILKVIIEACLLTDEQKVAVCQAAVAAGADFVKTSTGFSTGGATVADVALMAKTVGDAAKVKAAGGIRNRTDALAMLAAGASRLGTSAGLSIIE